MLDLVKALRQVEPERAHASAVQATGRNADATMPSPNDLRLFAVGQRLFLGP